MKYYIILFLTLILSSCQNLVEDTNEQETAQQCNPEISFSESIKPIIDNNCVQCHHGNRFPDLRNYNTIKDNISIIKTDIESRRMPIGSSLSQTDIDAISCWVNNGSLNN